MDTSTELATGLDRDIAALKAKAADYGARHKVIETVTWPNGRASPSTSPPTSTPCCCAGC
jgi:hypothetical protein